MSFVMCESPGQTLPRIRKSKRSSQERLAHENPFDFRIARRFWPNASQIGEPISCPRKRQDYGCLRHKGPRHILPILQGRPDRHTDQLGLWMENLQSLQVDKTLIELLLRQSDAPFSTTDLRDLYVLQISEGQRPSRNQLRKYIYRELLRLESAKLVERH